MKPTLVVNFENVVEYYVLSLIISTSSSEHRTSLTVRRREDLFGKKRLDETEVSFLV